VGKSTVGYLLASALKYSKVDVSIDDHDPQATLTSASERLGEVPLLSQGETPIIICDTAGHLDLENPKNRKQTEDLIRKSDRVLIVSEMSVASVEATATTAAFVKSCLSSGSKALIVWNKVRSGTSTGNQDKDALASAVGLGSAKNWIPLASCYEDSLAVGFAAAMKGKANLRKIIEALALEVLT
jgi:cellulose biosynthesis protein BcsQ